MRKFVEQSLLLATHNNGKIEELSKLFADFQFNIKTPFDFNLLVIVLTSLIVPRQLLE